MSATAAAVSAIATISAVAATVTTSASASATTTTSSAEFTARGTFLAGPGFAHRDGAAVEGFAIEFLNGALAFLGGAHGDKGKSAGTLCGAIQHQMGIRDRADSGEKFFQSSLGCLEGEVADIQFHIQWGVLPSAAAIKTSGCRNAGRRRMIATELQ